MVACDGSANMISLRVGGATYGPVPCADANGSFTISNVSQPSAGTGMVIWINGVASTFGSNVNRYSGSGDVTGIAVRRNRVIVQHDDAGPVTNANMGTWDNANDSDVNYDVDASNNLTVEAGSKLIINTNDTFTPGGTVTIAADANGDLLIMAGATLNGTYDVTVNGGDVTGDGTINLTGGTFLLDGAGNFGGATNWTFYNLTFGDGVGATISTATGAGGVTVTNVLTIAFSQTLDAGSNKTWTLSGSGTPFVINGTFTASTSTFKYTASTAANITATTYNNLELLPSANAITFTLGTGTGQTITTNGYLTIGNGTNTGTINADTNDPTLDVNGNFTISANAIFIASGSASFSVAGNWSNSGTFTHNSGTVIFDATTTGKTITTNAQNFYNLIFNGSGGEWTIQDAVTVANDLIMTAGSLLGTQNITVNGGDVTGDGTINLTGGTFLLEGAGNFGGATNWTFYNLTIGGDATVETTIATGTGSITVSNVLTIGANQTLDASSKTWTLSGSGTPFVINGTFTASTSTFKYTASTAANITATTYNNLELLPSANAITFTLGTGTGQTITTNGYLTIGNGTNTGTINADTNDPTLDVNGNFTISANATFVASATASFTVAGNWSNSGTFTHNSGTVTFDASTTGKTINNGSSSFYNVVFNNATGGWSFTAASNTIANDLTMTAGTLSGTNDITVNGGDVTGDGTINLTGGTFLLDGAGNFGGATAWTFYNLTIGGDANVETTTATGTGGITVSNVLIIGANQTLNAGSKTWTLSGPGTPLVINGTFTSSTSTFKYTATAATNITATTYNNLELRPSGAGSPTFTLATSASQSITTNGYLTIGDGTNAVTVDNDNWDPTLNIDGNFTISSGAVFTASATATFTVAGNWSNSGTFTHSSGTVTFDGTSQQTLSGTMTGSSAFYNLTITNTSGVDDTGCGVSFTPGIIYSASVTATTNTITTGSVRVQYNSGSTYTFTNNINWNGQLAGTRIFFRNSTLDLGTWLLKVSGTQTVSYVNVARSNASGGNWIDADDGTNTDCGNNTNWNFSSPTITLTSDSPDPQQGGSDVSFSSVASDPDAGDTIKLYICKDSSCSNCGPSDTSNCWAVTTTGITNNPSATFTCPICAPATNNYWAKVCDIYDTCSLIISGGTFSYKCAIGGISLPRPEVVPPPVEKPIIEIIKEVPEKIGKAIEKIGKEVSEVGRKIAELIRPKPPEVKPPEIPIEIPPKVPLVFQGKWRLLPSKPIQEFVLAPLPREIQILAKKFPELEETLAKLGIAKITDIRKLEGVKLTLPGLTERVGLILPTGIPIAKLSPEAKEKIPTDIVFCKTGGEKIDFNIALTIEKGKPEQRIRTLSGSSLICAVKSDLPVERIKGYIVFKSKKTTSISPQVFLTASLIDSPFFAKPAFAILQKEPIEEKLVLIEFEYTDPDGDGIYTAEIRAPIVEGEYEIITVMDYEDPALGMKEIRLITVVDPEGYIFEKYQGKELRIAGAKVSLYWKSFETGEYELWPAEEFLQDNPQITDSTGKYSFLVPPGSYYLKVEAPEYRIYRGEPFEVKEGSGIHYNIELKAKYWWLRIIDWRIVVFVLTLIIIALIYKIHRDKIRKRKYE